MTVNETPVVGSISQWDGGDGHVAYVEVVASSFIEISEDSFLSATSGYASRRRLDRSGDVFKAAEFIHVKDFPEAAPAAPGADFNGDGLDDIFWYGPGGGTDVLWSGTTTRGSFNDTAVNVGGIYTPINGDFNGDGFDDILWYGPGGSKDVLWSGTTTRGSFSGTAVNVGGIYTPVSGDFNGERAESMRAVERRAAFRFGRHKGRGLDGTTRWVCPFHAGRVRSRNLPWTMRRSRTGPLVDIGKGTSCCEGTLLVGAGQLPLQQPTIVGTRAWCAAMGRRNLVESTNGGLHGDFVDIETGYVRLLDTGRIDGLLAHSLAGYNRWVMRQWRRIHRLRPPDDPDSLPPVSVRRKPRAGRVARYADLPALGKPPPRIG